MELIVDVVKGSGTTIDGNTARRFFENLELTAEITGLNENEILYILLLQAVVSLQAAMYGWYNMYQHVPPTVPTCTPEPWCRYHRKSSVANRTII
jgi:hypothetical protein